IYDRVGDRLQSAPERLVSREEPPVDINDNTRSVGGRPNSPWPPSPAASPTPPATSSGPSDIEPKKVATIRIPRESSSPPVPEAVATGSLPNPPAAPAPATRSAMAPSAAPPSIASAPPRPAAAPAKRSNAPLTIAPQGGAETDEGP